MTQERENNKKRMLVLFLVALLINLALIFMIFFLEYKDHLMSYFDTADVHEAPVVFDTLPPQLQTAQQPQLPKFDDLKPPRVAALKSGASVFGATEQVQEEPEFKPVIEEPSNADEAPEEEPETAISDELREAKDILEKMTHRTDPALQEKTTAQETKQPTPMPEPLPGTPKTEQPEPQTALQKLQTATSESTAAPEKKKRRRRRKKTASDGQSDKIASPINKKLTFADLANGFVNTLNRGGQDYCDRDGDESIRPDHAEMKTLSYFNKLIWYMQNSWRQDSQAHTFTLPSGIKDSIISYVTIHLNKDGSLIACSLVESCGYQEMDQFVLRGIQNAAPFPPIPNHLKKETISFSFGVVHYADRSNLRFSFG